ncbi:MAG: methyltransferase domain-containing protein [Terriglobia bacterium]
MKAVESRELRVGSRPSTRVSPGEGYRLWAATYDSSLNPLLALEDRALRRMLPELRHKDALDIGCGTGRWLCTLINLGAGSVVGVDASREMIMNARAKPALRGRLVIADSSTLPLRPKSADVIVCSFTIGHVFNAFGLANELARVARPGADVFVTDMHPAARALGWRCAFRFADRTVEIETFVHALPDLRGSFEDARFSLVKSVDFRLGEPERRIFRAAGKGSMFESARAVPAVLVLHFRLSV